MFSGLELMSVLDTILEEKKKDISVKIRFVVVVVVVAVVPLRVSLVVLRWPV